MDEFVQIQVFPVIEVVALAALQVEMFGYEFLQ